MSYSRPESIEEALSLLRRAGKRGLPLSGGTDLLVTLSERQLKGRAIIDLTAIEEMRFIIERGKKMEIGAGTRIGEIASSPEVAARFTALRDACLSLGSPQIRNRATLGGNVANASPAADTVPPLCVYSAVVNIRGSGRERAIPIPEFFLGPGRSVLIPGEVIWSFTLELQPEDTFHFFSKITRRRGPDLAKVNIALRGRMDEGSMTGVRVAFGAVGPTVIMAEETASCLNGKVPDERVLEDAFRIAMAEVEPIDDARSTEWYRRRMAGILLLRALRRWREEAVNKP